MKLITFKTILILFCCASCIPLKVLAQKQDSLAPLREFLQVSSAYKQMPLYLEIEMKNSTNFITGEQDTLTTLGKFYLLPQSSYMRLGDMEQLVTDSLAILVSSKIRRIIVNTNAGPMQNQMELFSGSLVRDSSIIALSKKYTSEFMPVKEESVIQLNSRGLVYGSSVSKETLEMHYDAQTKKPKTIVSVKRMLVPLGEQDYQKLIAQSGMEKFLLTIEGKGQFLIKEQVISFMYRAVTQGGNIKIPVAISDRIIKRKNGEFEPVKAYQDYMITIN